MNFVPFIELFPAIAEKETRRATILEEGIIPKGEYAFMELYCSGKTCDCRRSMINVYQIDPLKPAIQVATLSYGWENFAFYKKWGSTFTKEMLVFLKGPALDPYQKQTDIAPFFLEIFEKMVKTDPAYVARLKNHYKLFKWKTGMKLPKDMPFDPSMPCPCGKGSKFRFCCGRK